MSSGISSILGHIVWLITIFRAEGAVHHGCSPDDRLCKELVVKYQRNIAGTKLNDKVNDRVRLRLCSDEGREEFAQILSQRDLDTRAVAMANEELRVRKAKLAERVAGFESERSKFQRQSEQKEAELSLRYSDYRERMGGLERSWKLIEDRQRHTTEREIVLKAESQNYLMSLAEANEELDRLKSEVIKMQATISERERDMVKRDMLIQQLNATVSRPTPPTCDIRLIKCERKLFR